MAVCSLGHGGASNPEIAGIQVMAFPRAGSVIQAATCLQCGAPECLAACPEGAIYIDTKTGARIIAADRCTGCRLCIDRCPHKDEGSSYYSGDGLAPVR